MDYKYIKRINWPWIEILDNFSGDEQTVVININECTAVWNRTGTRYYSGIRYKDGHWCEDLISSEALEEVKDVIMTHNNLELL